MQVIANRGVNKNGAKARQPSQGEPVAARPGPESRRPGEGRPGAPAEFSAGFRMPGELTGAAVDASGWVALVAALQGLQASIASLRREVAAVWALVCAGAWRRSGGPDA